MMMWRKIGARYCGQIRGAARPTTTIPTSTTLLSSSSTRRTLRPEIGRFESTSEVVVVLIPAQQCFSSYHSTSHNNKRSRFRWVLCPKLRDNNPTEKERISDPVLWKEKFKKNALWFKQVNPDDLEKRLLNLIATTSFKLPKGGFRVGILKVLIQIATKPSHLSVAQQCLSIIQHREPEHVWHSELATLTSKAAVRIGEPGIGLSFIQIPWLKIWPKHTAIHILLVKYSEDAEKYFLNRLVVGELPLNPPRAAVEDEEPEVTSKRDAKALDLWLVAFTETYKELRSDRHSFSRKMIAKSLCEVVRFYSAVGDVDAAVKIHSTLKEKEVTSKALRNIMLSLVMNGRPNEALKFKRSHGKIAHSAQGLAAAYLALGDTDSVVELFKNLDREITLSDVQSHFGIAERINSLQSVFQNLSETTTVVVPNAVTEYVNNLSPSPVTIITTDTLQHKKEQEQ